MEIILKDGVRFIRHTFATENEFEKIAFKQFKFIFGESAILFDKQKIRIETGLGTIPDAFVILPEKRKWYIIEVELASHNVYQHIIPQITKFKNALGNPQTRKLLTNYFDKEIEGDLYKLAEWHSSTNSKNIHRQLSEILDDEPELLIIIDNVNQELENASKNLPFPTRINIFKIFCRENMGLGDNIFQFDTFATSKKIVNSYTEAIYPIETKQINNEPEKEDGRKAPSPPANDWVNKIPELSSINGLYKWADICDHFKLNHKGNSARRVMKSWVEKNRPNWTPVPDA